jgi:hypothetical protein
MNVGCSAGDMSSYVGGVIQEEQGKKLPASSLHAAPLMSNQIQDQA